MAGLAGSLHCVGMCGGLVTASCNDGRDVLKYQAGRLLGYLIMGSVAFAMGNTLKGMISLSYVPLVSGVFLGCLFIFWGLRSMKGRRAELPLPGFLSRLYKFLFKKFVSRAGRFRSFMVGLISILLPCGLVYGLIISALALGEYKDVLTSLLFFWLGTIPAMVGAPQLIRKVLNPLKQRLPKAYAIIFILVGVVTIAGRLHHLPVAEAGVEKTKTEAHRCH